MKDTTLHLMIPKTISEKQNSKKTYLTKFLKASTQRQPISGYNEHLFHLFGLPCSDKPPIAPITALADGLISSDDSSYWLRADPIGLQVDWMHVFMLGNPHLQLNSNEINQYRQNINQYLKDYSSELFTPQSKRWYIKLTNNPSMAYIDLNPAVPADLPRWGSPEGENRDSPPLVQANAPLLRSIQTRKQLPLYSAGIADPNQIIGRSITDYLPSGSENQEWLKLFNELQMLLNEMPVNAERVKAGLPKVDALWLWGGGCLPQSMAPIQLTKVFSNDPTLVGLATLTKTHYEILPQNNNVEAIVEKCKERHGNYLISFDELAYTEDVSNAEHLDLFEEKRLKPIYLGWKNKNFSKIYIYLGDGYCYSLQKRRFLGIF